ncbi:MAG: chorismate transformation enzyme, FkbO/Hyg5 family [Thermoanaerobaculia bacterium]
MAINQRTGLEITAIETLPLSARHAARRDVASLPRSILGGICFDVAADANQPLLHVTAQPLGDLDMELWESPVPTIAFARGRVRGAHNGEVMFGAVAAPDLDLEPGARQLYTDIIETARESGYPHLMRLWNHVEGINRDVDGLERYKRFCIGRAEAFAAHGYANGDLPAASGVGMTGRGLAIAFLASRTPVRHVENPRQVSAYDYPARYAPRSPSFARATVAQWAKGTMIFVSGTASVVGHQTAHVGNVDAQLEETLRNLDEVIACAANRAGRSALFRDSSTAKLYVRNGADAPAIVERLRTVAPDTSLLVIESDICRHDLLLEIEAVVQL